MSPDCPGTHKGSCFLIASCALPFHHRDFPFPSRQPGPFPPQDCCLLLSWLGRPSLCLQRLASRHRPGPCCLLDCSRSAWPATRRGTATPHMHFSTLLLCFQELINWPHLFTEFKLICNVSGVLQNDSVFYLYIYIYIYKYYFRFFSIILLQVIPL